MIANFPAIQERHFKLLVPVTSEPDYEDALWECYASFPDPAYSLDKTRIDCEFSPTSSDCVLKGTLIKSLNQNTTIDDRDDLAGVIP